MELHELNPFALGYVDCALWASPDVDSGEPLDATYSTSDIDGDALTKMAAVCGAFEAGHAADLDAAEAQGRDRSCLGHDLFLSRNGHGTGFWDRGLGDVGDRLHTAAERMGESGLYVTDDGTLDAL